MRLWQRCLLISLLLNVLLAAVAFFVSSRKSATAAGVQTREAGEPVHILAQDLSRQTNIVTVTNSPRWAQIESSDFPTYIANLRAVGCPEPTIVDIITAEIEELYAEKMALVPLEARFWETDMQALRAWEKRVTEQIRLEGEKTLLTQRLLGSLWFGWPVDNAHDIPLMQFFSGVLDNHQAGQLSARFERFNDDKKLLEFARFGIVIPSDDAAGRELAKQYIVDLQTLIGDGQLREMKSRNLFISMLDRHDSFSALSLSAFQSRQIAQIAMESLPADAIIPLDDSATDLMRELMDTDQFKERLRQLLGEEKFDRYELTGAGQFRQIRNALDEIGVSKDLAFDLTRHALAAAQRANELRSNTSLGREAQNQALRKLRREMEESLGTLAGTNRVKFLKRNEEWLKELEVEAPH